MNFEASDGGCHLRFRVGTFLAISDLQGYENFKIDLRIETIYSYFYLQIALTFATKIRVKLLFGPGEQN